MALNMPPQKQDGWLVLGEGADLVATAQTNWEITPSLEVAGLTVPASSVQGADAIWQLTAAQVATITSVAAGTPPSTPFNITQGSGDAKRSIAAGSLFAVGQGWGLPVGSRNDIRIIIADGGGGSAGLTAEQAQGMIDTSVAAHNTADDAHGMTATGKSLLQAASAPLARKALDVGRIASGTGSPEGARSGVVGDLYVDTNQTLGAVVWVKTTASGATGWKVLFGDTGWRDITAMIASGFVPATVSPKARICRAAGLVQLDLRLQVAADASFIGASRTVAQSILTSMQSSWNPGVYTSLVSWSVAAGVWSVNTFSSPAILKCQSTVGSWAAGDTISALMTWPAVTPWVTAMLGTAV